MVEISCYYAGQCCGAGAALLTGAGAVKKEAAQAPALICTGTGSYLKIRTKQYHVPVIM